MDTKCIRELLIDTKKVAATYNEAVYTAYGYWKNRPKENIDHNPDEYVNIVIKDVLQDLLGETLISWEDIRDCEEEMKVGKINV